MNDNHVFHNDLQEEKEIQLNSAQSRSRVRKSGTLCHFWVTTCPTTTVHYVSMTSDLRVLSTEKH